MSSFGKMSGSGTAKVVLISGANRGIGLGLVRELIRRGGCSVVATCRSPSASGASDLRELLESNGQGWDCCQATNQRQTTSVVGLTILIILGWFSLRNVASFCSFAALSEEVASEKECYINGNNKHNF